MSQIKSGGVQQKHQYTKVEEFHPIVFLPPQIPDIMKSFKYTCLGPWRSKITAGWLTSQSIALLLAEHFQS